MALSHVILHVGLCGAIARAKPSTEFALRVRLSDIRGNVRFTKAFRIERSDDDDPKIVEFDIAPGTYGFEADAPQYGCAVAGYLTFLDGFNRSVTENLSSEPQRLQPQLLISGASPQSFLYVDPTFVLLDKSTAACGKPVGDLVPLQVSVENDQDAYYATLQPDPAAASTPVQLALRLKSSTHQYHYVRVPVPFPIPGGFPEMVHFDVTQDEIDDIATQPVGALLCLKLWETKVTY